MANKLYDEASIASIAAAIRQKNGSSDTYTVSQMAQAIQNIPSGGGDDIADNKWIMHLLNNPSPATIYDEFIIPASVTVLGNFQSTYNSGRGSLDMIPAKRFYGVNVAAINSNMWNYNKFVEELDFPNCTAVTVNCAEYASNLQRINFPKLKQLSGSNAGFAFSRCPLLTSASLPELETSGRGLFTEDTALASVYLPKLKQITGGAGAMSSTSLVDVCLPALEGNNDGLLNSNSSLVNASFPAMKNTITKGFLNNCPNLENLFFTGSTFITLNVASIFTNSKIAAGTGTIWVNDSLVNTYKSASNWSQFASVIRAVSEYTGDFDYTCGV